MVSDPRGDEPPYADAAWDDDIDFEALDCVEIDCEEIALSDEEWDGLKEESWNV